MVSGLRRGFGIRLNAPGLSDLRTRFDGLVFAQTVDWIVGMNPTMIGFDFRELPPITGWRRFRLRACQL